MPTRDERKAAAASNLALMRGAFSKDTQETIDAAVIYEDGEGRELELPEVEEGAATATSVTRMVRTCGTRGKTGRAARRVLPYERCNV